MGEKSVPTRLHVYAIEAIRRYTKKHELKNYSVAIRRAIEKAEWIENLEN